MSSRVVRDDLWTSERVNHLHDKTFRLYVCLINAADDFGLVGIGFGPIKRASPLLPWTREEIAKMLGELTDAGLIRPYERDGKAFAAIEKWQSFVRSTQPKNPIPTFGLTHILKPTGFKDQKTRKIASLLLNHLEQPGTTPGSPQGSPRAHLGNEGLRVKGKRLNTLGRNAARLAEADGFEAFWSAYPRKVKKHAALAEFAKLAPDAKLQESMLAAIEAARKSDDWTKEGGQFIPHPSTWLHGRRWEDEIKIEIDVTERGFVS